MSRRRERKRRDIQRELEEADVAYGYPWFRAWGRDPAEPFPRWFPLKIGAESREDVEHLLRINHVPAHLETVILEDGETP